MSLRDTESLVIESEVPFSLPDPTTVPGRKYLLSSCSVAGIAVSSTGATPFSTGGVNTATIILTSGQVITYQSDGVRWIARSPGGRAMYGATSVTDAAGNASFTFPAGLFGVAPVLTATFQGAASNQPVDFRVTAVSATAATINVRQSPVLVVLSLSVLGVSVPLAGATIHLLATSAGSTP